MSSINGSPASVSFEESERNEYCFSEEELQRLLTIDNKMVEGAHKTESKFSSVCIYRVPNEIRKLKESSYTPRLVSIGPLHSKDQHIVESPTVQDVKKSYANSLLGRISSLSSEEGRPEEERKSTTVLLMECVGQMKKSLDEAKNCYAEDVDDQLDEEMLVIDGCFILELLYRDSHWINQSTDPIFDSILMPKYIQLDLLLLENQLPFFVLSKLFDLTLARIAGMPPIRTLTDYVISYFENMWNSEKNVTPPPPKNNDYRHILHILHDHYCCHDAAPQRLLGLVMPCATDLDYAGVKFEVSDTKVRFHKAEGPFHRALFEIPTLNFYGNTEPFLRNLIAFEQCCHGNVVKRYFTSYAILMDKLIDTPKDVQVLEKARIIQNHLGAGEDASNLFNNLCKGVVIEDFHFGETISAANDYSKRCWSNALAYLKRKYFASPWTFLAFCAGFITFGISLIKFGISLFKFIQTHSLEE